MANLLKMMEKAAESFENLAISDSRCLQMISAKSKCTVCIDACPTKGIEIQNGTIAISSCTSCGICAKVCPTETFIWKHPTYESLYSKLKKAKSSNEAVIIGCIKSPLKIPEAPLIEIPCFSYLLDEIWTFLLNMKQGYIYLPEDACNECNHICKTPEQVKAIRLTCENDVRNIFNEEGVNRIKRDFLANVFSYVHVRGLTKWLKDEEVTKEYSGSIKDAWKNEVCELPIQISEKHLMAISINSNCKSCRACSMLCPNDALEQSTNDKQQTTTITINHDRCSTCGLCVDICYFDAVSIEMKDNLQAIEHVQV
ncbi:4Fe-4S binding protein [Bacillaceae bacterium IKA-2]|nr:4Fe-4S binding protein [Bacillaceae bacterium IKA-2]